MSARVGEGVSAGINGLQSAQLPLSSPATMKLLVLFAFVAAAAAWPSFGMMADSTGGEWPLLAFALQ